MFYDIDHVYRCEVPGYEGTGLFVGLKVVPPKEFDAVTMECKGLTPEGIATKTTELICSKIAFIEGYILDDGAEITDPKELYIKGLPGVWAFIQRAVMNDRMLSESEVKNS
jgi:hypothetical protein